MYEFIFGLIVIGLIIVLIIGLIKPSLVLRWGKPTRIKFVGWWFLSIILVFILMLICKQNFPSKEKEVTLNDYYYYYR